ncbi:hypothetical protein STRDD04_00001 [Streptococcus sp. DD04]|nr:hypothetical protein STRDD04_00001 [Streptococcus sp. DD04]
MTFKFSNLALSVTSAAETLWTFQNPKTVKVANKDKKKPIHLFVFIINFSFF